MTIREDGSRIVPGVFDAEPMVEDPVLPAQTPATAPEIVAALDPIVDRLGTQVGTLELLAGPELERLANELSANVAQVVQLKDALVAWTEDEAAGPLLRSDRPCLCFRGASTMLQLKRHHRLEERERWRIWISSVPKRGTWLEENCPPGARAGARGSTGDHRVWRERLIERGWSAPTWPAEYGGGGLDNDRYMVLIQELRRVRERRFPSAAWACR